MTNNEKLIELRKVMAREKIDALIVPTSDPHNSEYTAAHWECRKWISEFTGSAGTAVITLKEAALWTDSRYFIQAAEELPKDSEPGKGDGWILMKDRLPETPTIQQWLCQKMSMLGSIPNAGLANRGPVVGIDGMLMPYTDLREMEMALRKIGVTMRTNFDAVGAIWKERPAKPSSTIETVDESIIGETVTEKLSRLRHAMKEEHAEAYLMTDLMEIAWTLNLRGDDVLMTPVFIAFLYITEASATLFCNGSLTSKAKEDMEFADVDIKPYDSFVGFMRSQKHRTMADSNTTSYTLYNILRERVIDHVSPASLMKAIKSTAEIDGFRRSMLRDGVAMVKWLRWLKPAVEAGGQTEISVSDKLEQLRRDDPACTDLSFDTICGYNAHGAIIHYSATPDSDIPLKPEGLLLVDSGAQYIDGTTDITRTIALGPVTDEMRRVYTLVLKAFIALADTPFPEGTNGTNLDTIPHAQLWRGFVDYMHGSGHGVGSRLAVHEGPQSMRQRWCPAPVMENMTLTDEPGVYLEGRFGVRTENTMLVVRDHDNWLRLDSLTLCPIDTTPIDMTMMEHHEIKWLNDYHKRVQNELLPLLTDEADRQWLIEATKEITE